MQTRLFALIFGIVYTLIGVLGFISGLRDSPPADAPSLTVDSQYGYLFGLFPVNILHNIVHLAVGLLGIVAYYRFSTARAYAQAVAIVFAVLTVMGLIPGLRTTFGLIPLFSHDIWLHALTAVVAAYFGWFAPAPARERI